MYVPALSFCTGMGLTSIENPHGVGSPFILENIRNYFINHSTEEESWNYLQIL